MAESFHIDADLAGGSDNFDNQGLNIGFTFVPVVDGEVTGIRFRSTGTVSGVYTGALYSPVDDDPPNGSTDGTIMDSVVFGTVNATAWNVASFSSPLPVTAGQPYRARVHNTAGRYVARGGGFFGSAITRGNLTAIADGSTHATFILRNGTYAYETAPDYPKDSNGACFFVDVVFEAGGGTTEVTRDLDVQWRVSSLVSSDADIRWSVANLVSSDLDVRWRVFTVVTGDLDVRWSVAGIVSSDFQALWQVASLVSSDLEARWLVSGLVASDLSVRWVVRARVTSDLRVLFIVVSDNVPESDVAADFSPTLLSADFAAVTVIAAF
jgi:hypothetical protein